MLKYYITSQSRNIYVFLMKLTRLTFFPGAFASEIKLEGSQAPIRALTFLFSSIGIWFFVDAGLREFYGAASIGELQKLLSYPIFFVLMCLNGTIFFLALNTSAGARISEFATVLAYASSFSLIVPKTIMVIVILLFASDLGDNIKYEQQFHQTMKDSYPSWSPCMTARIGDFSVECRFYLSLLSGAPEGAKMFAGLHYSTTIVWSTWVYWTLALYFFEVRLFQLVKWFGVYILAFSMGCASVLILLFEESDYESPFSNAARESGFLRDLDRNALFQAISRADHVAYAALRAEIHKRLRRGENSLVIGHFTQARVAHIRRSNVELALAATPEKITRVASTRLQTLNYLRSASEDACAELISLGPSSPKIANILRKDTALAKHFEDNALAFFDAVATGRRLSRVYGPVNGEDQKLLVKALEVKNWSARMRSALGDKMAFAKLSQSEICQIGRETLEVLLSLPEDTRTRTLRRYLRVMLSN